MNDCLVTYIERDLFDKIDNEVIMYWFQNMESRRGQFNVRKPVNLLVFRITHLYIILTKQNLLSNRQ